MSCQVQEEKRTLWGVAGCWRHDTKRLLCHFGKIHNLYVCLSLSLSLSLSVSHNACLWNPGPCWEAALGPTGRCSDPQPKLGSQPGWIAVCERSINPSDALRWSQLPTFMSLRFMLNGADVSCPCQALPKSSLHEQNVGVLKYYIWDNLFCSHSNWSMWILSPSSLVS